MSKLDKLMLIKDFEFLLNKNLLIP